MKNKHDIKASKKKQQQKKYTKPRVLNLVPIETRTGSHVPSPYTS
jgi:hypothetical protein